ncbi:MAG: hypothetical protein AABX94_02370 [Nanoarchaeota archaeon]|mgnify:FL=1
MWYKNKVSENVDLAPQKICTCPFEGTGYELANLEDGTPIIVTKVFDTGCYGPRSSNLCSFCTIGYETFDNPNVEFSTLYPCR